jgi:hypothetical protein
MPQSAILENSPGTALRSRVHIQGYGCMQAALTPHWRGGDTVCLAAFTVWDLVVPADRYRSSRSEADIARLRCMVYEMVPAAGFGSEQSRIVREHCRKASCAWVDPLATNFMERVLTRAIATLPPGLKFEPVR